MELAQGLVDKALAHLELVRVRQHVLQQVASLRLGVGQHLHHQRLRTGGGG